MDLISNLIQSVGMNPVTLKHLTLYKPWGFHFSKPCGVVFHIITHGTCWLRSKELKKPIQLNQGDVLFLSGNFDFDFVSDLGAKLIHVEANKRPPLEKFLKKKDSEFTSYISGIYYFKIEPIHPFLAELPKYIHMPANEIQAHEPTRAAFQLLLAEVSNANATPTKSILTDRLVDIMLYYILREWIQKQNNGIKSWASAYNDPQLRNVLIAIDSDFARDWKVDDLAREAGISRAAFAFRFKEHLGDTPINYITKIRIQKAMELFVKTEESLEKISETVGYSTGFALSKAFKRVVGISPQQFREKNLF